MQRWKIWFFILESYFESTLNALKIIFGEYQDLQIEIALLIPLKNRRSNPDGWLKKLVRILVNLNRWVHTRSEFSYYS